MAARMYSLTIVVVLIGSLIVPCSAQNTLVLQNGLDNYTGCTDSYVSYHYSNSIVLTTNYGDCDTMEMVNYGG